MDIQQLLEYLRGPGRANTAGLAAVAQALNGGPQGPAPGYPASPYSAPPGPPGTVPVGGRVQTPWGPGVVPSQTPSGPMPGPGVPVGSPYNPGAGLPVPYQGGGLPAGQGGPPMTMRPPGPPMLPPPGAGVPSGPIGPQGGPPMTAPPGGGMPTSPNLNVTGIMPRAGMTNAMMMPMMGLASQQDVSPSVEALAAQHGHAGLFDKLMAYLRGGGNTPAGAATPPMTPPPGQPSNGLGTVGALAGMPTNLMPYAAPGMGKGAGPMTLPPHIAAPPPYSSGGLQGANTGITGGSALMHQSQGPAVIDSMFTKLFGHPRGSYDHQGQNTASGYNNPFQPSY